MVFTAGPVEAIQVIGFYPKTTPLRGRLRQDREFAGDSFDQKLNVRDAEVRLYSTDVQFPKVDVAGSIPVSRSILSSDLQDMHPRAAQMQPIR